MGMGLFDDDDAPNDDLSKIEINSEYARRFEHNKKREALQRYDELKKKGEIKGSAQSDEESDSESSSEEEEEVLNGAVGSKKTDSKFFEALIKVRNQDPSLKKDDIKLFESDDESDEETEQNVEKGKKAMYLKDVVAEQLIKEGPEFNEEDYDEEQKKKKKKVKSYNEEQEEMRKAFLDAVREIDNNGDDGEEFVKMKKRNNEDEEENKSDDGEFTSKLDEYFGRDTEIDQNQQFLKDFFMKKMWQDKEKSGDLVDEEEVDELLQDEEEIERQEGYELGYNFRHEENAGDRIVGFSRKIEGTVRKKENPRKEQRKRKEERMAIADMERKEELKHLKNLKKEEMKGKMKKVMEISGIREDDQRLFSKKELEEEFDPDEYDKMMKAVFDDKYYAAEDEEFGSDHDEDEKPDFDKEDELLGLPKDWDVLESGDGFLAARERILKNKPESFVDDDDDAKEEDDEDDEDDEEEEKQKKEEEETEEGKRKRNRKMSIVQKAKQQMMEEFYKLDYEDTIGDLKTRFKYAQTKPNRFGLKTDEILMIDDKDLNQYVSLKKIAPYTDQEWKVPDSKRYQIKQLLRGQKSDEQMGGKKRKADSAGKQLSRSGEKGDKKTQVEESTSDMPNQDLKQGKRKRRQDLKLPPGRLIAYGKVPSKPKKNKNK